MKAVDILEHALRQIQGKNASRDINRICADALRQSSDLKADDAQFKNTPEFMTAVSMISKYFLLNRLKIAESDLLTIRQIIDHIAEQEQIPPHEFYPSIFAEALNALGANTVRGLDGYTYILIEKKGL